ncbi:hypothetical protein EXW17_15960 [Enterococcus faecium]|nr:hypothetical protein [Enterococcus faecium]
MFLWLKTLYRKRAVTWPFIFYTIIWTLSHPAAPQLLETDSKKETTSTSVVSFLCLCKKQLQIKIMYQAVLHDFL